MPDVVEKLKALCPVGAAVDYSAAIEEHLPDPTSLGSLSDYVACAGDERAEEISLFRREVKGFTINGTRRALPAFALSTSSSLRRAGSPSKLPPTATPSAPGPFRPPSAPSSPAPP